MILIFKRLNYKYKNKNKIKHEEQNSNTYGMCLIIMEIFARMKTSIYISSQEQIENLRKVSLLNIFCFKIETKKTTTNIF